MLEGYNYLAVEMIFRTVCGFIKKCDWIYEGSKDDPSAYNV